MATEHDTITDPEIHEPKNISTADSNHVYHADNAGSGNWYHPMAHAGLYYSDIGTGTSYTPSTTYTLLQPATTITHAHDFSHNSLGRLTYTGTPARHAHIVVDIVFKHSTGAGQDCFFTVFKNGVEETGADMVQSADSTDYQKISLHWDVEVVTNDYFEIFAKVETAGDIIIHKMYMFAMAPLE